MIFGTEWKLTRRIDEGAPFWGRVAVSRLSPRSALWQEHVEMPLQGEEVIEGSRAYTLSFCRGYLEISFAAGMNKGAVFQRFDLRNIILQTHICAQDKYVSHLKILSDREVIITHNVTGPNKDYVMETHYERLR